MQLLEQFVITSYSIHYTKLYEIVFAGQGGNGHMPGISRREALRIFRDASLTLYLAGCSWPGGQDKPAQAARTIPPELANWLKHNSPINRLLPQMAPAVFSGRNNFV